ncbi:MAG TPA: hypothetical protein IAC01_08045 [Candidatus Limicola stercorigallinarum]|nr:hypothetical protein [Candidatus Limicola stercorigallinarum]
MKMFNRPIRIAAIASFAVATTLFAAGCSSTQDQQRIEELEQEVEDLKGQLDSNSSSQQSTNQQATTQGTTATPPAADATVTANYPEIADFETRVAALEESCKAVTASNDMQTNYQTYLSKKQELDALDDEMDRYDDQQEGAARLGNISYNDYTQIETAIDRLSDRLEYAEDSMMFALGIYDD